VSVCSRLLSSRLLFRADPANVLYVRTWTEQDDLGAVPEAANSCGGADVMTHEADGRARHARALRLLTVRSSTKYDVWTVVWEGEARASSARARVCLY
jgi:hypothetical protein